MILIKRYYSLFCLFILLYILLNVFTHVVHVKYLLVEVRRESVKFYMVLLVNTQNIASDAILLYYLLYPQHVQVFNKKMLKAQSFVLNTLPMSDPESLKAAFISHMSSFRVQQTSMSLICYITYIISDAFLASVDISYGVLLWLLANHLSYAVVYIFEFTLYTRLEELGTLLRIINEDMSTFRDKIHRLSILRSTDINTILQPSVQDVVFGHSQVHSHLYTLVTNDMKRTFGVQLLCLLVAYFSVVVSSFILFLWSLQKFRSGHSNPYFVHLVNQLLWSATGVFNLCQLIRKCEATRSLSLKTTTLVHQMLMTKYRTGLVNIVPLTLYSRQKLSQPIQFSAYGFCQLNFSLLYRFIGGICMYIIVFLQFRISSRE